MELITNIHMVWTVVVFILFICIGTWAYSSANKESFEKAARMALDDDKVVDETTNNSEEIHHG